MQLGIPLLLFLHIALVMSACTDSKFTASPEAAEKLSPTSSGSFDPSNNTATSPNGFTGAESPDDESGEPIIEADLVEKPQRKAEIIGDEIFVYDTGLSALLSLHAKTLQVRKVIELPLRTFSTLPQLNLLACLDAKGNIGLVSPADGSIEKRKGRPGLNAMAVSPDQRSVLLYHKPESNGDSAPLSLSANEAALLHIPSDAKSAKIASFALADLSTEIAFSSDGQHIVIHSQSGIELLAIAKLETGDLSRFFPLPHLQFPASKVVVNDLATKAYVIDSGSKNIAVSDFATKKNTTFPLPQIPTDLDILPSTDKLLLVSRTSGTLMAFNPATGDATVVETARPIGAANFTADRQLFLYSTANSGAKSSVYLTDATRIFSPNFDASTEISDIPVARPLASVALPEKGNHLLLFHKKSGYDQAEVNSPMYEGHDLVSILSLKHKTVTPLALSGKVTEYRFSTSGHYAYLLVRDSKQLLTLNLLSRLTDSALLPDNPLYLGVFEDDQGAFAMLEHDYGEIAFITPEQATEPRLLTGYALNFDQVLP